MTMILIDMHVHSRFSDGRYTPQQLAAAAKKRGLALLALTDHDTTSGLPVFMEACEREGVRGLCGIELSAAAPYTLHILGYRIRNLHSGGPSVFCNGHTAQSNYRFWHNGLR